MELPFSGKGIDRLLKPGAFRLSFLAMCRGALIAGWKIIS